MPTLSSDPPIDVFALSVEERFDNVPSSDEPLLREDERLVRTISRLKWLALAAPIAIALVLEAARYMVVGVLPWRDRLLLDAVAGVTVLVFYYGVFRVVDQMNRRLQRQNRELEALHAAGLDVAAVLSLEAVLEKVVDQARLLVGARYGAVSVIDRNDRIEAFVTSGISDELREAIGPPPVGHGLLGVVLREGQHLRLRDLTKDPRSQGFPPNHPQMRSLLAVPILCKGPFVGNLYLAEKESAPEFSLDDEATLERFAVHAAIAIDNAYLHQQVQDLAAAEERMRIAHEMHDGLAQVLGYVTTKVQAANEYLKHGRGEEASTQLRELSVAARDAYTDVREAIVGLRSLPDSNNSFSEVLREYVARWKEQSKVSMELDIEGDLRLPPRVELQVLRIVQEALSNVRKHAHAENVRVVLRSDGQKLTALVADDGVGFDPEARHRGEFPRFGLTTMRERAESVGGSLTIESSTGAGSKVTASVPTAGFR